MKTILRLALGSVLAGAALTASAAPAQLLVKFKPNASSTFLNAGIGAKVVRSFPQIGWQLVSLPATLSVDRATRYYGALSTVARVDTNVKGKPFLIPNDPLYGPTVGNIFKQYQHEQIRMPAAWELSVGSPTVTVAVIDTGTRRTHEDLVAQVRPDSMNAIQGQNANDYTDVDGHGTHVAGLAAATANNGKGGAGTGWNVRILGLKAGDPLLPADAVVAAILYAADKKVQVINMSFGFGGRVGIIDDALKYAHDQDCVLVAAAGNDNTLAYGSPALSDNVLTVGSTDQGGGKSSFSNFGLGVEVAAPGRDIVSTATSGDSNYIISSGTSMASPVVAGAIALLRAYAPDLPNTDIVRAVQNTAIQSANPFTLYGEVNIGSAILQLSPPLVTNVDPSTATVFANEGTITNPTGSAVTDAALLSATDSVALEVRSNYLPSVGTVTGVTTDFAVSVLPAKIITSRLEMSLTAANGVTMLIMFQNATTGAYEQFTSARLSSTATNLDLPLPRPTLLRYLKSNGTMRVMLRAINPSRLGPGGSPFRTSLDSIGLRVTSSTR